VEQKDEIGVLALSFRSMQKSLHKLINDLTPALSRLHLTYSVDGNPFMRIEDFNRQALGGITTVIAPSQLDDLDPNAPTNTQVGAQVGPGGPVVSQIYKSPLNQQYKSKGPKEGRY
jgi:hypothetical protein